MNETLTDLLNKVFSILSIVSIIFSLIIITIFIVRSPRNNIVLNTKDRSENDQCNTSLDFESCNDVDHI